MPLRSRTAPIERIEDAADEWSSIDCDMEKYAQGDAKLDANGAIHESIMPCHSQGV